MAETEQLITSKEAREMLGGINRSTLVRWVDAGLVKPVQKLDGATGAYLFTRAEIERRRKEIAA